MTHPPSYAVLNNKAIMNIKSLLLLGIFISCTPKVNKPVTQSNMIIGTWKLISAITIEEDSTYTDNLNGKEMIKIINESHFSFLNHDINNEKDSLNFFVAGGGIYTLEGNKYTEHLNYCNYRKWEGNTFEFIVEVRNDTLIQRGIERIENIGVDRKIIETYIRQ